MPQGDTVYQVAYSDGSTNVTTDYQPASGVQVAFKSVTIQDAGSAGQTEFVRQRDQVNNNRVQAHGYLYESSGNDNYTRRFTGTIHANNQYGIRFYAGTDGSNGPFSADGTGVVTKA